MSQTYFSKLDPEEKEGRLVRLGSSQGKITVWIKGKDDRHFCQVISYYKNTNEIVVNFPDHSALKATHLLCSFELRGALFFSQIDLKTTESEVILKFNYEVFKSERRGAYRLLTYPIYDVWAKFDLGESYQGGKVVQLKSKMSQTNLFKNFLTMVDPNQDADSQIKTLKLRVQDLSVSGMAVHVGDVEGRFFEKDSIYNDIKLQFLDETLIIPELKVVYLVNYIGNDKYASKYKVGIHFTKMDSQMEDKLSKKISSLLREIDFNLDFEKFVK